MAMTQSKIGLNFKPISLSALSNLRRIFIQHNEQWIFTPANDQDLQNYTLLHEHLASLIGHHDLNSVFDTVFFDEVVKRVTRNKNLIFALRSASILSLTGALTLFGFTFGTQSLPMGVTVFMLAILGALSARKLSDLILRSTGCLIEDIILNAKEPKLAKKVIHELETKIFGEYEFYFIDQNGVFNQLPKNLYRADNSIVFLLGKSEHRHAVPFSGYPPKQDIYILKRKPTKDSRNLSDVSAYVTDLSLG